MGYSIVIRTLGKAGEKYQIMLQCIENLQEKPEEVLVVIPKGYELTEERLGYEKFIRSEKGMVRQRCEGARFVQSEYILFLDDDLAFPCDFIEELKKPLDMGIADVSFPILPELLPQGKSAVSSCLAGSAIPMVFEKDKYYIKILRTGGYSYNKRILDSEQKYFYAQSAPGACLLIRTAIFNNIHFEEEEWLEKYGYAMGEDQVLFYKLYIRGYKVVCVSDLKLEHLDAGTSTGGDSEKSAFGSGWFKYIFWRRFIYDIEQNIWLRIIDRIAFGYCFNSYIIVNKIKTIKNKEKARYLKALLEGGRVAKEFLCSDEYAKIPVLYKKSKRN